MQIRIQLEIQRAGIFLQTRDPPRAGDCARYLRVLSRYVDLLLQQSEGAIVHTARRPFDGAHLYMAAARVARPRRRVRDIDPRAGA